MVTAFEAIFPGLSRAPYEVTSQPSKRYNCIAWAAGKTDQWWWPGPNVKEEDWPADVARLETLAAFQQAFASLGYEPSTSDELETGLEKIALFADDNGHPQHAARQLSTGRWTSKLGRLEDIEHGLRGLEGTAYGSVVLVMRRQKRSAGV